MDNQVKERPNVVVYESGAVQYEGSSQELLDLHMNHDFEHPDDMMNGNNYFFIDENGRKIYLTKEYIKNYMSIENFNKFLESMNEEELAEFEEYQKSWQFQARTSQRIPPIWHDTLLFLGGRGSGKTRAGAEWTIDMAMCGRYSRVNILGPTKADVENTMLNGPSGILTICRERGIKVEWKKTDEMLVWPNGTITLIYSAEEPERLRGVNSSKFWIDEVVAFKKDPQLIYNMLILGLRIDEHPSICLSTTPKNNENKLAQKFLRFIVKLKGSVTIKWKSKDNDALGQATLAKWESLFGGTHLGKQELEADLEMDDSDLSAIFNINTINRHRVDKIPEDVSILRKIVAIDPSVSNNENSDECGIVVAGLGDDKKAYILEDLSGKMSSKDWGTVAVKAYYRHGCDLILAESNNGGDLVETTITNIDQDVNVEQAKAKVSKGARATPVGLKYEQGLVCHVGKFDILEDQMCDFDPSDSKKSPDRMDALVWAVTQLLILDGDFAEEHLKEFRNYYSNNTGLPKNNRTGNINKNIVDEAYFSDLLNLLQEDSGMDFNEMFNRRI